MYITVRAEDLAAKQDVGAAIAAASITNTPAGGISSTNVQAAINELDSEYRAANTAIITNYQAADAALTTSVNGKVAKAGDTMTGPLVLPVAAPTLDPQAANKKYVDDKIASIPTPSSLTVSDTPPVGVPDGALWWESDSGLLYVKYNDGNTSQWVIAAPQPDINAFALKTDIAASAVRYDTAQSLSAPQQQQARQNIYAAPFDAMAYSGLQINGGMEVSQERGTAGTNTNGTYICDGWKLSFGTTMGISGNIALAQWPGWASMLYLVAATAQPSLGVGEYTAIQHYIEGWRIARLAWGSGGAQPITIGFWTMHHRPGLYSGSVRNGIANRSYVFTYTQTAADALQYNVITIPGNVTGTWAINNTAGINLTFTMAAGSTFTAPSANTWVAGSYFAASGQVNAVATTSDAFRITGVIVLPGNEAPLAQRSPFVMRPFDQELLLCKRQLRIIAPEGAGVAYAATGGFFNVRHDGMRATPTVSATAAIQVTNVVNANYTQSSPNATIFTNNPDWGQYNLGNFSGMTAFNALTWRDGGLLKLDARL